MRTSNRLTFIAALTSGIVMVPAAAFAEQIGMWHMDDPQGATLMTDSAGIADDGEITSVLTGVPGLVSGTAFEFEGDTSGITVPDVADRFDPRNQTITMRATIRVPSAPMADDSYEIIRKGYTTSPGGTWKMEIKRKLDFSVGKLQCVFKGVKPDGTRPVARLQGGPDLADGERHSVTCTRTATGVVATVDGQTYRNTRTTGSISNTEPVMIGSKIAGDDVFRGVMDEVSVDIG